MSRIAFIGIGVMGGPMARHLASKGHELTVYNRSPAKAEAWVSAHGGRAAASPIEAARDQDAVITCVGTDDDLAEVTLGREGAFRAMRAGAVFIDHTTVSARIARQLAVEGKSAGQTTKMVNQIAIAGVIQGLAEALRFAQHADLDLDRVFEAISGGAAASWQMLNRWPTMARDEFDFGFAVDWMRKDLGLAIDEARTNGATLPVASLVDQFYADLQAMGAGRQDTSALVRRLPK
jgi:3-hydroxyisobutyrate dehydrogenase